MEILIIIKIVMKKEKKNIQYKKHFNLKNK